MAPDGTLAEWLDPGVLERLGQRTASHLLGTWFEPDVRFSADLQEPTRELTRSKLAWRASAAEREEMAYGLVQLGLAASAIGDASLALECVERMSRLYFLPSLSTTHDVGAIFNVDIAGGFPAVIQAMLIGSAVGRVELLPALPWQWPSGAINGVYLRGGVVVDALSWTPTQLRLLAHTIDGARTLRRGEPIRVTAPAAWAFDSPGGSAGAERCDVDPFDGEPFIVSARR